MASNYQFPHKNIKGIYMKYPYAGKIFLDIGGAIVSEVYNNDGVDKNMLDVLDCKLPLHLVKYNHVGLRTETSLISPSDVRFVYSDEVFEEGYTHYITDNLGVKKQITYEDGLFWMKYL